MEINLSWEVVVALNRAVGFEIGACSLASKPVERAPLSLQGIHHVHGGDGFPLGVLAVGDRIADDVLQEDLEDSASFFIDETGDALHSSSAGQSTNGRLGDALDVVTEDFSVAFGTSFTQSFTSFAASSHGGSCSLQWLIEYGAVDRAVERDIKSVRTR